jgi:tRNA threonylcarbamoyladenosine biosynthesis protein TsaB
MVRDVMRSAGAQMSQVARIGVTVGPGSFTGLRVGLSFAKGLSLGLGRPCVGVDTLEALVMTSGVSGWALGMLDAARDRICWGLFRRGRAASEVVVSTLETVSRCADRFADGEPLVLVGRGTNLLAPLLMGARAVPVSFPSPLVVARLASTRRARPAAPVYLRPATGDPA